MTISSCLASLPGSAAPGMVGGGVCSWLISATSLTGFVLAAILPPKPQTSTQDETTVSNNCVSQGEGIPCSGDLRGAVEAARTIQKRYSCLPMRRELLIHLIDHYHESNAHRESAGSRQLLEDMLNLIAEVKGSVLARHDLLFAYLEAGRPSEAAMVLKNLAKELDQAQVTRQLEYYVKTENEAAVVHLVTASLGEDGVDRQAVYASLINIYYVRSEGEKGLSLWTSMQEEGITPSPAFLTTLAALLAACKIKIPFQI
ncbi:Leucine-rich PPR motif-containing protein, mitochondrial [Chionoecetes opilio]|uniref:Leucine-rich PPR motif-containing protein, mitochondrial n=1 Tax=Chionoecetes opilio TaxID=41210 RepID=A0A8J4XLB1_CHIOP|nr:Leucine-rich PPR motif-containing protein, mitochondrial [Chionoecetes opilio]